MALVLRVLLLWFFFFFLSFFFLFLMHITPVEADDPTDPVYHDCLRNSSTTTGLSSTFKHNLNSALHNLTSLAANARFASTSTGSAPADTVYAMFQCRGDQTLSNCSACVRYVADLLPDVQCPTFVGARNQVNGCFLRYDNQSFFLPDFEFAAGFCFADTQNSTILKSIEPLVQNVTTTAPKNGGFAMASSVGTNEYALAQCLGYLTESECSECLNQYFSTYAASCPKDSMGEQLHLASCYVRHEPYDFFATASVPPAMSPSSAPPQAAATRPNLLSSHRALTGPKAFIIIGIPIVVGGAILATIFVCLTLKWRHKLGHLRDVGDCSWRKSFLQPKLSLFSLHDLEVATQDFHSDNKLGEGAFGQVYKGVLVNGECIAIKKLCSKSQQGDEEFINEVKLLATVQHKNLIKLHGSCVEGDQRLLVYEYLPKKSLNDILFEEELSDVHIITWPIRYGIILGMARGLTYLHEESQAQIIHRDIKPSNILLDDHFNPIISDFGLARLVQDDITHILTKVAGTIGYIAPEYSIYGELSDKVDVFSFGVVTLEVISGKRAQSSRLLAWAWRLYLEGHLWELVDGKLGDAFLPTVEEISRVIIVALLCTQENPKERPTMFMVTLWLLGESNILDIPIKPSFVDLDE